MAEETSMHILQDCPMVEWFGASLLPTLMDQYFMQDMVVWLEENVGSNMIIKNGIRWSSIFSISLDLIWKGCDNLVFNQIAFVLKDIATTAIKQRPRQLTCAGHNVDTANFTGKAYHGLQQNNYAEVDICWYLPQGGWIKGNSDGSLVQ